jgi:Uma2 family endonuclease
MGVIDELPADLGVTRHRLTVADYYRMAEVGLLAPEARVELIEGSIVDMAPIGSKHASIVKRLNRLLTASVGSRAIVSVQDPIRLGDYSVPQPDLALLKPRADDYADALPTAADTVLVIEVSHSTAAYDRQVKTTLYAKHGIPEVWIVDLDFSVVRFYRRPEGERYLDITATETPGPTPVAQLPGVSIDLSGVL